MIPTLHGILQQKQATISVDDTSLVMAYPRYSYSEYCAINVTPDTMSTTLTKVDTGDGTSWATVTPSSGTGDYSFRGRASSDNSGSVSRSMIIRITDNAGVAASVDVVLTQVAQTL